MTEAGKIAIPVLAKDTPGVRRKMERAAPLARMLEIRLDLMEEFDLKELLRDAPKPLLVTYRSRKEGGNGRAHYSTRVTLLEEAIQWGADFVDVEFSMPLGYREPLLRKRGGSKVILSRHILNGTPSGEALSTLLEKMTATGADIVKIVTRAKVFEDNRRVLDLIPLAGRLGIPLIAFCLGPLGRTSRIISPLLGGFLTFASLDKGEESADGQITAGEMKEIFDRITGHEN
jgi:3-dehydroquinate dehydratase type I